MRRHDFAPKLAKVITEYSRPIQPGQLVALTGNLESLPLLEALYVATLERGGNPHVMYSPPGFSELFYHYANDDQLDYVNPIIEFVYAKADVLINIEAPLNTKAMASSDPTKIARSQAASGHLFKAFLERIGSNSILWGLVAWPTQAAAQQTDMGFYAYSEFLYRACGLHLDDPVGYWMKMRDEQTRLVEWLKDKSHAVIKGPGIDMSFDFQGRIWESAHGELNFPDGEIFTGPIEDSVNGWVHFNMKSIYYGREVDGIKFRFEQGRIVEASAIKGEDTLMTQLDMDEGARRLGEFAIGTNFGVDRITGSILLDEKIGGSIHMAIGNSIPQTLGVNESKVHWDIVHGMQDGGKIWIDDVLFYDSGKFKV
ncbi:MAG: aminopeptidase [Anaerolineae bacterium]|nr:aminopeptidase [Anaerolineae bacterium]